jgi:hypothetical protein
MFERVASFLLGLFTALLAVLIYYWTTVGRFRHRPVAEERRAGRGEIIHMPAPDATYQLVSDDGYSVTPLRRRVRSVK